MKLIDAVIKMQENPEVFRKHMQKYGANKQLTVLIEECTELAQAGCKIKRAFENNEVPTMEELQNFAEEYSDLLLMMKQFESFVDEFGLFEEWFERKFHAAMVKVSW